MVKQIELERSYGAADNAATHLLKVAKETGEATEYAGGFNGTPMVALPSDEAGQAVFMRWHYERLLDQLKRGVISLEDI